VIRWFSFLPVKPYRVGYTKSTFFSKIFITTRPSFKTYRKVIKHLNLSLIFKTPFLHYYSQNLIKKAVNALCTKNPNFLKFSLELKNYKWFVLYSQIFKRSRHDFLIALLVTIFFGLIFTLIQYYEYKHATFSISDSVYGSTFFLTTGFHGLHVIIGTLLLIVCFFRGLKYHFTRTHHVGLESAIWYWHFVDVVWLGLYISIYHWGGAV